MKKTDPDPRTIETPEEARQGERQKGMPAVLGVSTALAVIALGLLMVLFLSR